mgnify:CR=1 FL=1
MCRFHNREPKYLHMSLHEYRMSLIDKFIGEEYYESVVHAANYILSQCLSNGIIICSQNIYRISLVIFFIAAKVSMDFPHNVYLWAYFGGISVKELKELEYDMLVFVNWNVIYFETL